MDEGDDTTPFYRYSHKRADLKDPEVRELADEIIKAQRKEIAEMKAMIERLEMSVITCGMLQLPTFIIACINHWMMGLPLLSILPESQHFSIHISGQWNFWRMALAWPGRKDAWRRTGGTFHLTDGSDDALARPWENFPIDFGHVRPPRGVGHLACRDRFSGDLLMQL